jgi:hypothetical protein
VYSWSSCAIQMLPKVPGILSNTQLISGAPSVTKCKSTWLRVTWCLFSSTQGCWKGSMESGQFTDTLCLWVGKFAYWMLWYVTGWCPLWKLTQIFTNTKKKKKRQANKTIHNTFNSHWHWLLMLSPVDSHCGKSLERVHVTIEIYELDLRTQKKEHLTQVWYYYSGLTIEELKKLTTENSTTENITLSDILCLRDSVN